MILSKVIKGNRNRIQHELLNEIILSYKKNDVKIPICSYLLSFIPTKQDVKKIIKFVIPKVLIEKYKKKHNRVNDGWLD